MDFKIKCALQTAFSNMPKGETVNYWFQKHITHSLPVSANEFDQKVNSNKKHLEAFHRYVDRPPEISTYYEFGAGWDLITPIFFSSCGFKELHVVDIRKLIIPELLEYTLSHIFPQKKFNEETLKELRVEYNAPADARNTSYESESMDFIVSNATLEHIPKKDILPILKECNRLLKPDGVFSSVIDYTDHYSYFDNTITPYNFLKYSEKEWKRYNPSLHYQNRLRHKDYLALYKQAGFELLEVHPAIPSYGLETINELQMHSDFEDYSPDELAITGSLMVAKKIV